MAQDTLERDSDTLNPGQENWDNKVSKSLAKAEGQAAKDDDGSGSSSDAVRNSEKSPKTDHAKVKQETSVDASKIKPGKLKVGARLLKSKGPLGIIGALLVGGGGLFSALISPGLAIVQIKEALMEDLQDAVAHLDLRSKHVMRSKLKASQQTSGFCTKSASFRCKYKTMSNRQVKKLQKQGFIVEYKKTITGRVRPVSLGVLQPDGSVKKVDAKNFNSSYNNDAEFRSRMNRFYAPKWHAIRDKVGDSVKKRFKYSFNRALGGTSREKMRQQYEAAARSGVREGADGKAQRLGRDSDGKTIYVDDQGNEIKDEKGNRVDAGETEKRMRERLKPSNGFKSVLGKGANALSIVGAETTMCQLITSIKVGSTIARNAKYAQLLRFVVPLFNTADAIKTGNATPEAVEFVGEIATHQDMRDMILSEDSLPITSKSGVTDIAEASFDGNASMSPTENKHKGQNAFDSVGLKTAMYGEANSPDLREAAPSFDGGAGGTLMGLVDKAKSVLGPFFSESNCPFLTNPWVIGGGAVASVVIGIFTGGGSAIAQGTRAAVSLAFSIMIEKIISSMINDVLSGRAFDADTKGVDAGNAWFAGAGALGGSTASGRGIPPLATSGDVKTNQEVVYESKLQMQETERYIARSTPFDIYNKYSFLGSIAASLNPTILKTSSSTLALLSSPFALFSAAFSRLSPTAGAATISDESRFTHCADATLKRIGITGGDIMCNLRFGLKKEQVDADPQKVVEYMIDAGQVDADTGDVITDPNQLPSTSDQVDASQLSSLNLTQDQVAAILRYDDEATDSPVASDNSATAEAASVQSQLPPSRKESKEGLNNSDEWVEDVRTYAHYMRFCRFGPDDGRKVNFGDPDTIKNTTPGDVSGVEEGGKQFIGKECIAKNTCADSVDNPNTVDGSDEVDGTNVCRPPIYDIYDVYTLDKSVEEGMDMDDEQAVSSNSTNQGGSKGSVSEDGWAYPTTKEGQITSPFGVRWGAPHNGIDLAQPGDASNNPIYAARDGKVIAAGPADGFGNWIIIQHEVDGKKVDTVYGHMYDDGVLVKVGDTVKAGDQIGKIGSNGQSTGPHLHFEIWEGGRLDGGKPIDPEPIVKRAHGSVSSVETGRLEDIS